MKRILNALFVGALMAAAMAFGPPALASPQMGNDLIAATESNNLQTPYDTVKSNIGQVAVDVQASAAARSTAGSETLNYSPTNDTACEAQHFTDVQGVVGPGWRSATSAS